MDLATLAGQDADCCIPLTAAPIAHEDAASSRASSRRSPIPRVRLLTLCDITEPVGLSQPTVSHHLKILVEAGLLAREQRGTLGLLLQRPPFLRAPRRGAARPHRTRHGSPHHLLNGAARPRPESRRLRCHRPALLRLHRRSRSIPTNRDRAQAIYAPLLGDRRPRG
ncbi:ArsR family transcriptional regulator [Aeromicrobium flavum]|uniref:ArsR family transcriptional regulator n=1 Tax=Aeromicrobium flavum TaxID=416568 RepID=UPI0011BE0CB3|nr:ArsR family transcriptional regulator [Aeromicrobium flavum]